MPHYNTEDIRNIALVGHAGSGKTTLAEALLATAGAINNPGSVDKGNTVSDFEAEERDFHHSLGIGLLHTDHQGVHVNLVDTPGYPDFIGQTLSVLPAVETIALVVNAQNGLETTARRLFDWARQLHLCRLIIVNKIDGEDVDLPGLLEQIQDAFGKECLPINLPAEGGRSVVDCFFQPSGEADFSSVADAHTALVDQVVEVDEELMALYLEQGEEISPEQLHDPFEEALREGHLMPVCFTSATEGVGMKELLDVFERLMPNPAEGNPHPFLTEDDQGVREIHPAPDPNKHVLAHVFKVAYDPFVGKLSAFRIHQGTITKDTQLFVGDRRKAFKVGHLFKFQGKDHPEIERGIPGDICAVAKVEEIDRDAILHDSHDEDNVRFQLLNLPTPVFGLAIRPKSRGDEQKLSDALHKLTDEDPCLVVEHNVSTNETVLRGLGELHLRIALQKLTQRFNVEVDTQPPKIAYRETITQPAEGHHRHKKQSGGAGQFGEVFLRIEPLEAGGGFEFVNAVVGGAIPGQFIPAVEKGVRQVMTEGAIAGYPMQDIRVTVYDGKFHSVDSNEVSFVMASRKAFVEACSRAKPLLLEPIMTVAVAAPQDKMGDISGDLSTRRGRITDTRSEADGSLTVTAQVPLAELEDYQSRLKSMTGGEGSFTMELAGYEPVPANVQQQIVAAYKPHEDN